ncbi:von Willebrand factor type A [Elysia marginata]|uniref:von Willebrand factor type A n=1 Tax=Elysia marginata TaxID=1093978 RepID=A0AAV4FFR0_9GAST|nr:von Willebrand factor type A [Elysia marginata]
MSNAMPPMPLEIVFSFDTTGSMFGYLEEIRAKLRELIQRLQADIPAIRVAVIAHGDYCDASSSYVTKFLDLTTDVVSLCDFVHTVGRTGGGDAPECYELVLREIRTKLSWSAGSRRAVVIIGDNLPHEVDYPQNKLRIDWKEEVRTLAAESVTIYAVQCGNVPDADAFFETMAVATDGKRLRLADMTSLFDLMMAVCYRESDNADHLLSGYEKEVRARYGETKIAKDIEAIFATLRDNKAVGLPVNTVTCAAPVTAMACVTPVATEACVAPKIKKTKSLTKVSKPAALPKSSFTKPKDSLRASGSSIKSKRTIRRSQVLMSDKYKQSNLPLLKRENVPERNFALRWLKWSQWVLAVANQKDIPTNKIDLFVKRKTRPGYRLKALSHLRPSSTTVALFEVAVQGPGPNRPRHVVFSAFSRKCLTDQRWDNRLLRPVAPQINRALGLDFKVFVRFCLLSHPRKTIDAKTAVQKYDYAWRSHKSIRSGARRAEKGGLLISE